MSNCSYAKLESHIGRYLNEKDKGALYVSLVNMFGGEDSAIHCMKTYSISAFGSVTAMEAFEGNNAISLCRYVKMKELGSYE